MTKINFETTIGTDGLKNLNFDTNHPEECCQYVIENKIKKITLYSPKYTAKDLSPLFPIKNFIDSLFIAVEVSCKDIHLFKNLKEISLDSKDKIDLSQFPLLESFYGRLSPKVTGLNKSQKLKTLFLSNYSSKTNDLTELPKLKNLEHLGIFRTRIKTLKGIENFPGLTKIEIYSASQLETISDLINVRNSLTEIEFNLCKKVSDYFILSKLTKMKKMILSNSGTIKTLSFIPSMKNLKFFSFWGTDIIDGDLSFCKNLDYVGYDNKRHYNLKSEDFKDRRNKN